MKRIFASLAVCAVVLSLTACSNSSDNTGGNYGNYGGNTGGNYSGNTGGDYGSSTQTPSTPAITTPVEETKVTDKTFNHEGDNGLYTGDWKNGAPNGNGTFVMSGVYTLSGEWLNGHLNGQGQLTLVNGDYYEGNFTNCKFNGRGHREITLDNGSKQTEDGTYNNNRLVSGTMSLTLDSGTIAMFDGEWGSDKKFTSGSLLYLYTDATTGGYEGEFSGGVIKNGATFRTYSDGSAYYFSGDFSEWAPYNGEYAKCDKNGSITAYGKYVNGKSVSGTELIIGGTMQGIADDIANEHPFISWLLKDTGYAIENGL